MEWKKVIGFEDYYMVSSFGHIMRIASGMGATPGKILKPKTDKDGYLQVVLCVNNIRTYTFVHTIVAAAFLGPRPEGYQINHKDTIKLNCEYTNLEYLTRLEHEQHAIKMGQKYRGDKHWTKWDKDKLSISNAKSTETLKAQYKVKGPYNYKYSDIDIAEIFVLYRWQAMTLQEIANTVHMSVAHIHRIKEGKVRTVCVQ